MPEAQDGHLLGYARVSTADQHPELQQDALERAGCYRVWTDHGFSGKLTSRPALDQVLDQLRPGDTLVVWRLDRLGRSLPHLIECHEEGLPRWQPAGCHQSEVTTRRPVTMLHAGLDLSRTRLDVCLLDEQGGTVQVTQAPPDTDGLRGLARQTAAYGQPVRAAVESMNGARFVHDQLELCGWQVAIADAAKVKGLAPLACKTDRIDARVLAELSRRDLVPEIWLPTPEVRAERERARFRLHLVRHRTSLKNRIHATLLAFGKPCPTSDLFGGGGRELLARLALPQPWAGSVAASLALIDDLEAQIDTCERDLRRLGADHPCIRLLVTTPGIAWVLGYTIAAEIGDIARFPSPKRLGGYTGLCPRVYQSGSRDHRGPLAKNGPTWLRWALIEAATHAARHPVYRDHHQRIRTRLGKQRGPKVARVEVARKLAEAIWHMLTRSQPFAPTAPARPPAHPLVA